MPFSGRESEDFAQDQTAALGVVQGTDGPYFTRARVIPTGSTIPVTLGNVAAMAGMGLYVSVTTYGAVGDGTTDDTAAVQSAITAGAGKTIFFPPGSYLITSVLVVPQGTALLGVSAASMTNDWNTVPTNDPAAGGSWLCTNQAAANVITFSGNNCSLTNIGIKHTGATTVTSGKAINITAQFIQLNNVTINGCWDAVYIGGATQVSWINIDRLDCHGNKHGSLLLDGSLALVNDVTLTNSALIGLSAASSTVYGIWMNGHVEAFMSSNVEIVYANYMLFTAASVMGTRTNPCFGRFVNTWFDLSGDGVWLEKASGFHFSNCWFVSSGVSNTRVTGNGVTILNSEDIVFNQCEISANYSSGMWLNATVAGYPKKVRVTGCNFIRNNLGGAGGVGIFVDTGVSDFVIQNCAFTNVISFSATFGGAQSYGVQVNTGTSDRYIISDNLVTGNATGGVLDNGTGVNKRVANNY